MRGSSKQTYLPGCGGQLGDQPRVVERGDRVGWMRGEPFGPGPALSHRLASAALGRTRSEHSQYLWLYDFVMTTPQRIRRSSFNQKFQLADWRVINHSVVADFLAPSFSSASAFVVDVAVSADACEHHPDIEIRYPGTVRITLTTHAANGLTELDASLATTISQLAMEHSIPSNCSQIGMLEVAIDALNIAAVMPFWKAVLGYIDEPTENPGYPVDAIMDPLRIGPPLWFQQMDSPRPQRNRIHLDVKIPHDLALQRIERAVAAGGKLINAESARAFWVLADPEGNEICICTWQDRG